MHPCPSSPKMDSHGATYAKLPLSPGLCAASGSKIQQIFRACDHDREHGLPREHHFLDQKRPK